MNERQFLESAYDLPDRQATAGFYGDWAATYDDEIAGNGYATPARCAAALAGRAASREAPVLDIGCGTGLSGLALRAAGFTTIDGTDFSAEMLGACRASAASTAASCAAISPSRCRSVQAPTPTPPRSG